MGRRFFCDKWLSVEEKKENFSFCYQQRQQTKREHFWPLLVMFALILKFRNFSINGRKCIALRENWGKLLQKLKIRVTKNGGIFMIFYIISWTKMVLVVFLKSGKMLWHCNGWESILKMPKEDDLIDKSLYPSRIFSWSWLTLKPVRDDHQAASFLLFEHSNIRFQKLYLPIY